MAVLVTLALGACGDDGGPSGGDASAIDAADAVTVDGPATDGPATDANPDAITAPLDQWSWIPIDGSQCGSGARAGIGINPTANADELVLFFQGGGACWNRGTCAPSFEEFGPACFYNPNACLVDAPGGTQPTAAYVTHPDPYPADGSGAFTTEIGTLSRATLFDRTDATNPMRAATYVYVPYCTGDLHAGDAVATYTVRSGLFDPPRQQTMHFAGARNVTAMLGRLVATYPRLRRIWIVGISGGGYGAQLSVDRVAHAYPTAELHVLSDSGHLIDTDRYTTWASTWNLTPPTGCTDCAQGFPAWLRFLIGQSPNRRFGLLAYDRDRVIAWFFLGGVGPDAALNPPLDEFRTRLLALRDAEYRGHANARTFVVAGDRHVFLGDYEVRRADGTLPAPLIAPNGVALHDFIRGWATGVDWNEGQ